MFTKIRFFPALVALLGLLANAAVAAPAAKPPADMSLERVTRGSLLMTTDVAGAYRAAPLQETDAVISVTGPIARTRLRQRFINPGDSWAEALYAFPLPTSAAVDHLRMRIGDRVVAGIIQEKGRARATYRAAKTSGKRAALVEQQRPNLFTTAVANIPPQGEITVEIEYQQELSWRGESFGLRFPMAITPRYSPAGGPPIHTSASLGGGWALLPGELPNSADLSSVDADTPPLRNPVTLRIELQPGFALGEVRSRHHAIVRTPSGGGELIELAGGSLPARHDFELEWQPAANGGTQGAFFTETTEAGRFGLLMLMPPAANFPQVQSAPRELIFVIDTSGSMGGASIRQARAALDLALSRLNPDDAFNIVEFNSRASVLFKNPMPADSAHIGSARRFVANLNADGGTNMLPALQLAFGQGRPRAGYLRQIVFITDGAISNEAQLFEAIHAGLQDARLFTVGIGSAPNNHFMSEAAVMGRGSSTLIGREADVGEKMGELFAHLERPALTDLALDLPVARQRLPDPLPDLYVGQPLSVIMRLDAEPDRATITGQVGGRAWSMDLGIGQSTQQSGLGVMWARSRIRHWMREKSRGSDAALVREKVLALALDHHLVSVYTSLVAVDETPVRPPQEPVDSHALKTNLPAGLSPGRTVSGKPVTAAAQPAASPSVALAAGATPSLLMLMLGALASLAGVGLGLSGRRR